MKRMIAIFLLSTPLASCSSVPIHQSGTIPFYLQMTREDGVQIAVNLSQAIIIAPKCGKDSSLIITFANGTSITVRDTLDQLGHRPGWSE